VAQELADCVDGPMARAHEVDDHDGGRPRRRPREDVDDVLTPLNLALASEEDRMAGVDAELNTDQQNARPLSHSGSAFRRSRQRGANQREERVFVERLRHVVDGAQAHGGRGCPGVIETGEHDDRRGSTHADSLLEHLEPVGASHDEIEEDEIDFARSQDGEGLRPVLGVDHRVGRVEHQVESLPQARIVVDDQDRRPRGRHRLHGPEIVSGAPRGRNRIARGIDDPTARRATLAARERCPRASRQDPNDKGVDAVYVDHATRTIFVIQGKYRLSRGPVRERLLSRLFTGPVAKDYLALVWLGCRRPSQKLGAG